MLTAARWQCGSVPRASGSVFGRIGTRMALKSSLFHSATTDLGVFAGACMPESISGSVLFTTKTIGVFASSVTGEKSLTGSYPAFFDPVAIENPKK